MSQIIMYSYLTYSGCIMPFDNLLILNTNNVYTKYKLYTLN